MGITYVLRSRFHGLYDCRSILRIDDPDLQQLPRPGWADEHRQSLVQSFDPYCIVKRVQDVLVIDPVTVSALGDERLTFTGDKLACNLV